MSTAAPDRVGLMARLGVAAAALAAVAVALVAAACGAYNAGSGDGDATVTAQAAASATPDASRTARASVTASPRAGVAGAVTSTPASAPTPSSPPGVYYRSETPSSPPVWSPTPEPTSSSPPGGFANTPGAGGPPYNGIERITPQDLAARGTGTPGRGAFNIARIVIARLNIDALVSSAVVSPNGVMPSPPNKDTAVWYDFSAFPDLGGLPGKGGNVVIAGDALRPDGNGVFTQLNRVPPDDIVRLRLIDGSSACYRVRWNKLSPDGMDFMQIVAATRDESLSLITAGAGGTSRRVLWAVRVAC